MRISTVLLVIVTTLAGCATPSPREPAIAAPAPFAFDPVQAGTPFIRRWLLLGPFEPTGAVTPAFFDEAAAAPRAGDPVAGHVWTEARVPARVVDFHSLLGTGELGTAYAFAYLHAAVETDVVLWLGADDMSRMLLNGRVVQERRLRDSSGQDGFCVPVHLKPGVHRLLVRVENIGGPHGMWLRMADAAGGPIHTVVPSLSPDSDELASAAAANATNFTPAELLALLPVDTSNKITFDAPGDLFRFAAGEGDDNCPSWRDAGGPDYGASPGRRGAMLLHPASGEVPQRAYWKVRVPESPSALRFVVSPESFAAPGRADVLLRAYVFDGELRELVSCVMTSMIRPSVEGWEVMKLALPATSLDREVLIVLEANAGGGEQWFFEGLWFDEVEIVPAD